MARAERRQLRLELIRRGLYGLNAIRRVAADVVGGRSPADAWERERVNLARHKDATKRRVSAAKTVDAQAEVHGNVLGWHAVLDSATTPDCRQAHGKNFRADRAPSLGYPGTVHGYCRCVASSPWPRGAMLR